MPFCPHCGSQLLEGAAFCSKCGLSTTEASAPLLAEAQAVEEGRAHQAACPRMALPNLSSPSSSGIEDKQKRRVLCLLFAGIYVFDAFCGYSVILAAEARNIAPAYDEDLLDDALGLWICGVSGMTALAFAILFIISVVVSDGGGATFFREEMGKLLMMVFLIQIVCFAVAALCDGNTQWTGIALAASAVGNFGYLKGVHESSL